MDIKLLKAKFSWTYIGFIRLNIGMLVTLTFIAISNGTSIERFVSAIPLSLLIVNAVVFVVFPIADVIEQYKDKQMCSTLGVDYIKDFLMFYEERQKEIIRENFKNSPNQDRTLISELLNKQS